MTNPKSSKTTRPLRATNTFRGLDVPMEVPACVERADAMGKLPKGLAQPPSVEVSGALALKRSSLLAPDEVEEVDVVDELHREEPDIALHVQLMQRDQVGMNQIGEGAEFLLEAIEGIRCQPAQDLDRYMCVENPIVSLEDRTKASLADLAKELIPIGLDERRSAEWAAIIRLLSLSPSHAPSILSATDQIAASPAKLAARRA